MPVLEDSAKGPGGSLAFPLSPADHDQENATARSAMLLIFPLHLASSPSSSIRARAVPPSPWKRRAGPEICVSAKNELGRTRGSRESAPHLTGAWASHFPCQS